MATRRLTPARQEWVARFVLLLLVVVLVGGLVAARRPDGVITVRAAMPENGGWQPGHLSARVGEPLRLRLTSTDVVHSFAVGVGPDGQPHGSPEVEILPGQVAELALLFDQPGVYTYSCTRWCGANHWRMRGTIEVLDARGDRPLPRAEPPLYLQLGLDIDAPHPASVVPGRSPSAAQAAKLDINYPQQLLAPAAYLEESPVAVWLALRSLPDLASLDDDSLWDAVAYIWRENRTAGSLAVGEALYSQNCAACHGEGGAGDGVFAVLEAEPGDHTMRGHSVERATDFTGPDMRAASNALLQGKIIRGGMGTGMPAWGAILSDEQIRALLDYLWTFQFPAEQP
jgi:mono/diheme cytochrome c family protein/plastocyanin